MSRRQVDLKKVFQPSDAIAFLVIVIGLFIALFLDEMAVRLIGVCITILGGVALFMMVSPRLTDMSMSRPPRPTESPSFLSETKKDALKTSQVFDSIAYRATFGGEESVDELLIDERQQALFPGMISDAERRKESADAGGSLTAVPNKVEAGQLAESESVSDGQSSVRILGIKKTRTASASEPRLAIRNREARRAAELRAKPPESNEEASARDVLAGDAEKRAEAIIEGPVTEEIQLSDDVIVRPKGSSPSSPTPTPTPTPEEAVDDDSQLDEVPEETTEQIAEPVRDLTTKTPSTAHVPRITIVEDHDPSADKSEGGYKRKKSEISVTAFMADADEEMEFSDEPRLEFDFLLNRVLMVIRSAVPARTTAFFWFNRDKQELVLEAKITDSGDDFTDKRKIPVGYDAVSQIALEGRPEILTEISPAAELDLIPYYRYKAGTLSFVGVPVYFKGNVVGVLCADATEANAYTDVTVGFFGHFTKLISGLVANYTGKFDLQHAARTLDATNQFKAALDTESRSEQSVVEALFEAVVQQMEASTLGVCSYDHDKKAWTVLDAQSVLSDYAQVVGQTVDLDATLIGSCIKSGEVLTSEDTEALRVSPDEYQLIGGQFVAVPLRSQIRTYGALYIENHQGTLTPQDFLIAEVLGDLAGEMIEEYRLATKLRGSALLDNDTNVLNQEGINRRLKEEFARAADQKTQLTFCLIRLDPTISGTSDDGEERRQLFASVLSTVREQLRDYDVVGRYGQDIIGVGLVSYSAQEAQFWIEGIRREIAGSAIESEGRRTSATISVGVAETNPRDTWESLLDHTLTALEASAKHQNKVTVLS